jgi:single-stranded DNA-binding protein
MNNALSEAPINRLYRAGTRMMKIPALNTVHLCGVVLNLDVTDRAAAIFDIAVSSYRPGRRRSNAVVAVRCFGDLATAVSTHLQQHDVVIVTGSLQNDQHQTLGVVASVVQFLTDGIS